MSHEVLLSQEGYDRLKKELEELKSSERQRVADNIREAKSHGDLKENAMYHEAKLNQTRLESRIAELEHTLQMAKVVTRSAADAGKAHLGSQVTLEDLEWGGTLTIDLVGAFEADPANDKISVDSPLGAALIDKVAGDEIEVQAPAGKQRYRVVTVA
ncbi:MAG: transcription elongation factor GreA [Fimbriimonadaceae bacterium]|nr:transcription elongation factor GreA [Fimbriimonadaceae bacterium]